MRKARQYSNTKGPKLMAIPTQKADLERAGYLFDNEGKCRGCGRTIEWWITPTNKKMPMRVVQIKDTTKAFPQPVIREDRVPHFADCEKVEEFRSR
jgi:hypothetical protein